MSKIIKLTIFLVFIGGLALFIKPKEIDIEKPANQNGQEEELSLIFVGDIMLDRGVGLKINFVGDGDFSFPFQKISDELKAADIVFGNLEGPISDKGTNVGSEYSFRMDPRASNALADAGFNVLSLANNHAFDYGRIALEDTYIRLKNAGIDYTGGGLNATEAGTPVIKEVNGTKFTFLAYTDLCPLSWKPTENTAGINCITQDDLQKVKDDIASAKKKADIVIVSLHSGNEYAQDLTQFQTDFSHSAIDAGADLVAGHHPHVVQKSEQYKDKWIFYSLGNFIFDQNFSLETMQGLMVKVIVKNDKIQKVIPIETQLNDNFQAELLAASLTPPTIKPLKTSAALPAVLLSSNKPLQGDAVLITVQDVKDAKDITSEFEKTKINFFKSNGKILGIFGIDAKKTPGSYKLTVNFPDKSKIEKTVTVVKRNFPVTVLAFTPELEKQGYTATSVTVMIKEDSSKLYEAMATSSPAAYFDKSFGYPLDKITDVGAFGNIRQSGSTSLQHLGTDLDAEMDTKVYTINDGVIKATLDLVDYGNTIVIDHGLGIFSLYLHLNQFLVQAGQKVTRGQVVALSGNSGYSIAPHLHFSVKAGGASVDPIKFVQTSQF